MKQNLLFNQASALGKRLAMVLTMLLIVGVGQAWGAEGDVLKTYDTSSSTFASGYSRKTGDNFVWWGQKGYYGANSATNHGNLKPTASDLPVVKAQNSSATTNTTGYYYLYTSEAIANVGKVEIKFTAKSGSSTVNAYIVSSSTEAASGSATWTKVTLASNSSKAQGANVATATTYTFTFDATETDAKYYGVVFVTSSYWRATNLTFKLYEGAPVVTEPHTVIFYKTSTTSESVTEKSAGDGVTPPTMEEECGDWTFQGWSESPSNSETSTTKLDLVTLDDGIYYPTADAELYPVYTKSEGGGGTAYTKVTTISEGVYVMVSEKTSGTYKYMPNTTSSNANPNLGSGITISTTSGITSLTNEVTDAMLWDFTSTGTANQFYLRPHGSTTIGLGCTTSTGANIRISSTYKDVKWTITTSSSYGWQFKSNASSAMYLAVYSDSNWRNYTSSTTNQNGKFHLFKQTSSSTTYYFSYPQCATQTLYSVTYNGNGSTSGSVPVDNTEYEKDDQVTVLGNTGNLAKTGHTFNGWNTKADGTGNPYTAGATFTITENTTLYAQWTAYTVTWTISPTTAGSLSATSGNSITVTPDAAYTYGSPAYTVTSGSATVSQSDNTFTATPTANCTIQINMVEKPKWTVTFYAGEHGTCATESLTETTAGAGVTLPDVTPNDGYRFIGWATTSGATTANAGTADETYKPESNITLYAVYKQLHTITWMVGSNSVLTEEVANATGVTQTPADPANNAIGDCADAFVGWSEKSAGSTPQDEAYYDDLCTAEEMKAKYTSVTSDKTFYAVFATAEETEGGTMDVTTSVNIGTYATANSWEDKKTYSSITIDENITATASKSGGSTSNTGYYSSSNAHWRFYQTENSSLAITAAENCTIQTVKVTYTVENSGVLTYNGSNQTSNESITINATSATFGVGNNSDKTNGQVRITEIEIAYVKPGGTTITYSNYVTNCCATPVPTNGSYTSPSGTSVTLTWDGESTRYHITGNGLDDYTDDESYTITGLTECNEYTFYVSAYPKDGCESEAIAITAQPFSGAKTVTFNPNGGAVSPTSFTTSCDKKSTTLPTPTYSGYRFMGWYTEANGGILVNENPYSPDADITLHAHWAKEYSVTYNANGGSTTCANGNYIEGETVTLCTSTPSKTGYTFAGWTYSPEVTITDGKFTMPASNVTITAQWTINQYTVTWNPNGGKWGESTADIVHTYDYGAKINLPADPTREGYRFIGWNATVASTMPATNITYTAQWKQNYTITFHDGDDITPWTQTIDAESIDLNTYVGTHACGEYNFAGWSTDATQYNDQTANITTWVTGTYTPTASIDLYAVYVKGDLATDFTLNCDGGVYEIWENGTNQHMAGRQEGGGNKFYTTEHWDQNKTGSNGAPFTITKVADQTYTLQNADGQYITGNTYDEDDLDIEDTWENADKYKWTISAGSNGTWRFTNKVSTNYALIFYDKYFQLRKATNVTFGSDYYDLELTPAQTNVYQSNPNCGPYTITFETGGGEFIQGNYKYSTKKTSNLTEPTISQFPAAELDGYTFAGWKDGSPQEDINYEPYLKKADDNLVVSSNKTYHAVYYYYDEEEEIDWSEEFTTGMYAEVNGTKYFLSGTPNRGTMSSTTDCGYVSEVTITPGTGANAGKYKITVNGVGMAPEAGEPDLVPGTAWWTITETSAGSGEYKISGETNRNVVLNNSSFGHYAYNAQGSYNGNYHYPSFGKCLEHHWTSNPPIKLTVTYNPNGATSGNAPIDNNYYQIGGKVYVLGSNDLQKENYAFGGWNTQADGLGDNYEEGEDFNITKNTTLYAKWDCATYVNITKGTPVNGTFNLSVTGTQYTCENGFVVSVTDIVPATGYRFDHITQDGVDAANVEINNDDKTVTYKQLSNGSSTINVVFVAIPYTVTWEPNGGNWDGSTDSKVDTYNYGASITKPEDPTRTGYTFAGWSPTPAATMPAANQTYTAQWDCVAPTDLHIEGEYIHFPGDDMTLTVMGDNIADDATYVWKKGGQVVEGQTTATLTINHCDVTHAGNYVCTVTNGSCSAEANFTVKIFHLYGLKDNTWTQPYVFMKDAEANKAILYVDLDAATSYDFKLKNGQEWYWNEGTMTHNNCTDWTMPQEGIDDVHGNTWITTTVAGTYAFKLDYTDDANLVLSVVYPAKQMIYLDPGVWDIDGAIFVAHVWTEGIGNDKDIRMTKVNDCADREIYEAEIEGAHNRVIFVRCNPSGFSINNIWEKEWNRSSTQWLTNTLPGYQFNIEERSNGGTEDGKTCSKGSWSAFIPYHTISYDMNGHGTQISDECIKEGNTWSAPTDPTEVGYTFQGWRRPAATGDSKLYKNGQTGYKPTASETLTAQWQINQCVVTWKVNAQEVAKTTVDITNPLTSIPHTPTDDELGCCAEKFIGWSTETNPTKNQVYTTASELQNLIGTLAANTTKTFHAVFATPVPGAGNSLVTFNEMGYANEEAVASVTLGDGMGNGDATITFNKGTAATYVPTYYNIGEAVRTYAGNTITVAATYANTVLTQIDFAFAKGENANAITASTGTITDGVWTGNAQSVTFTISGATGHRRIASIAITTAVTGDQYTNYVTKCDLSGSASIGAGTITYAVGNAIEVKCGQRSPASKAATLTFASAQDLTCPVTIEASAGFLVSTNKNDNSKYESNITVKPVKTGANKGKLPTIYVRAEANFGVSGQMNGTITASGDEITTTQVNVVANVTCTQYTLTVVDHLGNTISTTQYYEGDEVAEVDAPATDDCSKDYTFDGWSETSVEYGSLIYNKVSFPYSMPANDVTLYPVYVCSKDYHRVTEDLGADNWEGQYLIAHSNTEFANGYQGGTTDGNCIGGTNSVRDLSQYITNDVVSKDCDIRSVKLIAVNGGYVLQTRDGKYNYITAGTQSGLTANDNLSTADDHPLTIIFNSETDIAITNLANVNQASLQYSATYFRFYKPGNQNPVYLYKKYLYTTPLICGTIEAEDAVVTSTAGQTIKVNVPITITSTLGGTTNITAESDNDHFAVTPLENVATGEHTIAVHYTPDATTDGTESANITLTASHGNRATTTFQVTGRHLPENFVIAAKWGENWYVLPADMTSESITEGLLIEVDDSSDPTKALAAPNTTKYGLKSVYTTSGALDRYKAQGENIVFVENITGNNKTLYNAGGDAQNSTNTNIQVYAQYKTATGGYYETNPGRYEWIPTTTDLKDYTLTSAHTFATEAARTVSLDNHGIFGTLLQDKSYNGMVRLLPVDNFYEPIELQVVEWKQNSVSVMYTGAGSKYTTKVGNNAESSVQPLSKIDHVVYSLSTTDLTTATNQPLIIYIKNDADVTIGAIKLTVPAIISENKGSTELSVTAENAKATNIVILDGATLTAGTTKYTYNDVVVYPGGNLVIDTDGKLGMYTLTLRAGSSWGAEKYENKYPQFLLKGDYSNTSGQINLDYVTTADYYYPLSVPEEVTIRDIKYPVDIYGSNVDKANTGSFQLKYYDGKQRVDQGSQYGTGWIVVDENTTTTLTPNQGYAIWGIPKKINGTRQTYGIHRIPIKKAASDLITNETTTEEIAITAHGDASTPPNDRGWNYLGNPYLAGLGTNDDTDVQMGLLVQEMIDGKWTGGWVNNGEQVRYVTLTNDCQNFEALPVSEATILPFTTFFVQAAQTGAIALNAPTAVAATASVVARRYAAQQETAKEITTGILLTGNDQTDRTGLLIADNFTEEYDYNADLSKFENSGINLYTIGKDGKLAFMAINQALAEQPIPVGYTAPAEGLYTIAFDEDRYNATDINALYLIDYDSNEKTNLLYTDYSFVTAAGTNNQRFALQVAFAPENATNVEWVGDATIQVGVEGNTLMLNNLPTDASVHVFDALGRLMYHAPTVPTEMQLTLPTGYYLVRIADKQNAVVIKTVIP